jgi:hypothetical protein
MQFLFECMDSNRVLHRWRYQATPRDEGHTMESIKVETKEAKVPIEERLKALGISPEEKARSLIVFVKQRSLGRRGHIVNVTPLTIQFEL